MSEDGYIPEKQDYSLNPPGRVPLTAEDAIRTVLVRTPTADGLVDTPTKVAYGLPNDMNRDASNWEWANCQTANGGEWSHFKGHRICVDILLTSWNEREVNAYKGFDHVKGHCSAVVSFNKVPVWEVTGNDIMYMLSKLQRDIEKLLACTQLTNYVDGDHGALVGRKIYWRDQPAIITSFIGKQGCVMIKADPGPWILPAWRQEEYLTHSDYEDEVKADLLDPHIWWWRDPVNSVFPEGVEATLKAKQVVVLTRDGEPILDTQGDVYEWNTIEEAKQDAYELFNMPAPVEDPVDMPVDANVPVDKPLPMTQPVSTPVPYARFEETPILHEND